MMDARNVRGNAECKYCKIVNAPPEKTSQTKRTSRAAVKYSARTSRFIPGTGMLEPILKTTSIRSVKINFF